MFFQNQMVSRLNSCIRSNQVTKMPANTGIMIAHRNGLLLAQDEHSISQPMVGIAHNAYSGMLAIRYPATFSGLAGPHNSVSGLPPCSATMPLEMIRKPIIVSTPAVMARAGATTAALATLDSTVARSDSGSDFQNSTLRSLRSSYRLPRQ